MKHTPQYTSEWFPIARQRKSRPSIFLAPIDICGIYSCLTRGLREIGCRADFLNLGQDKNGNWDESQSDAPVRYFSRLHRTLVGRNENEGSWHTSAILKIRYITAQVWLLAWVIYRYDAFVLKSGEFMGLWGFDVKALKLFRKKIVVIFQGSDSRPPFLRPIRSDETAEELLLRTRTTRNRVANARSVADFVLENPLTSQNHTGHCCLYQAVGIVIDEKKLKPGLKLLLNSEGNEPTIRILHAPSDPELKGSDRIRACISNLVKKGYPIEYVEVTGRPNDEVLREIARCDIVVDELYSDVHGAVLATEGCALGKPVLVGGYGKETLARFIPGDAAPPTIFVDSDDFESELELLVIDSSRRQRVGQAASDFFRKFGDRRAAAERLVTIVEGRAPPNWFFDPLDVIYAEGVGGERSKIAGNIAKLVQAYGEGPLMMDHHPRFRDTLLAFMRKHGPEADLETT